MIILVNHKGQGRGYCDWPTLAIQWDSYLGKQSCLAEGCCTKTEVWRERGCLSGKEDDRYACNACWDCTTSPSWLLFPPLLSFPGPGTMFWSLPAHMIKLVLLLRLEHILPLVCSLASPAHPLLYLQSLANVELSPALLFPECLHSPFSLSLPCALPTHCLDQAPSPPGLGM